METLKRCVNSNFTEFHLFFIGKTYFYRYTNRMIQFIYDNTPWIWLAVAIICTAIEAFTFGLATIWFAIGAVAMIFISFLPIPLAWQVLVFLVISTILLVFTRPIAVKKLKVGKEKTNTDELSGKIALVVKDITKFDKGEVKVNGIVWTAQSSDDSDIPAGTECVIESVHGVTLTVSSKPSK